LKASVRDHWPSLQVDAMRADSKTLLPRYARCCWEEECSKVQLSKGHRESLLHGNYRAITNYLRNLEDFPRRVRASLDILD